MKGLSPRQYLTWIDSIISGSNGTKVADAPIPRRANPIKVKEALLSGKSSIFDGPKQRSPAVAITNDIYVTIILLVFLQIQLTTGAEIA